MATIERAGKTWRIREPVNGKRTTVATATTKAEAQAIQRRLDEAARIKSKVIRGSVVPLFELIARWERSKTLTGNDPLHTGVAAERLRNLIKRQAWTFPADITPQEVQSYREGGGCARTCGYLSALLRWAGDTLDQFVDNRTLVRLRPGKTARKPKADMLGVVRVAAAQATADNAGPNPGALVHCLSTYGWRPITAARLLVGDFNPDKGEITTKVKGGDVVRHPLHPDAIARLQRVVAARQPAEPLFLDPRTGKAWEPLRGISLWSRNHLKLRVYDLKRHAISTMLELGLAPQVVALFTGHRTLGQVLRYARTNDVTARKALERFGQIVGSETRHTSTDTNTDPPGTDQNHQVTTPAHTQT